MKNPNHNILIHRPQDLSVSWAQRIVSHYAQDAKVTGINIDSVDVGTSTRLKVFVEHDAPQRVPRRWFVKTPSLAAKSRAITALPRFLHKEVSFYNSLSTRAPVRQPQILAAQSRFGRGSTLVMTDLAELGFTPGHPADALTVDQAKRVIEHLARLHGHFWNKPELLKTEQWLKGLSLDIENHMGSLLAVPLMKRGLQRAEQLVAKKMHAPALRYAAQRRQVKKMLAKHAQTLVHHDCHPGNIFWIEAEPGFLDWQLVRMGDGVGDVAYFLATALEPECRRKHEQQLLAHYLQTLNGLAVTELDERQLYQRYRAHLLYPLEAMLVTLAIGGMMKQDSNREMIRRSAAAVEDHDCFALVPA